MLIMQYCVAQYAPVSEFIYNIYISIEYIYIIKIQLHTIPNRIKYQRALLSCILQTNLLPAHTCLTNLYTETLEKILYV